ncbi:hypothetical protein QTP88_001973 [Uroleucon formosanum]
MRRAKLNASDILSVLNDESELDDFSDDSDVDRTWQPTISTNIGQSDCSGLDSDEDQVNTIFNTDDINITNINNDIIISDIYNNINTNHVNVASNSNDGINILTTNAPNSAQVSPNIGWSQTPFATIPLPEFYGPHNFIEIGLPISYVEKYLPNLHFEKASMYTNMYALAQKGKELKTTPNEIKVFYGAQALMGVIKYPRLNMYWQRGITLDLISSVITRDRFTSIRTFLHYVDVNNRPAGNTSKFWKVQPIIDCVQKACREIPRYIGMYSIDEQMVPFTGRCPHRQFVKNKPRPVGLKNFVITTSKGLVLDFELYQGSDTPFDDRTLGLGPAVVLHLTKTIPKGSAMFFDRYFTTIPLMNRLNEIGIYATGTIMSNRLKNVHFSIDKKFNRGVWEEFTRADNKITAVKWKDSKCVTIVSTATGAEPHQIVKRWSKVDNKEINVNCPAIIQYYNQNMGGVDLCNQQMEAYRTWIKTKKWTLKVAVHFIDLAIVNAWMEYKNDAIKMNIPRKNIKDLLEFKISVAKEWLSTPTKKRINEETNSDSNEEPPVKVQNYRSPIPSEMKRYDSYDHWPEVDNLSTARNCRKEGCKSRTRIRFCKQRIAQVKENRDRLRSIVSTIILCGRQNIPLRGHRDDGNTSLNSVKNNQNSVVINQEMNFRALLRFRIESGDSILRQHLEIANSNATYISKTVQTELIDTCKDFIQETILARVKETKLFSLIFNETTDISHTE